MNDTMAKNIKKRINNKKWYAQIEFIYEGIIVGILAGIVAIIYRFLLSNAEKFLFGTINYVNGNTTRMILWFLFLIICALVVGKIVKWEPMSSGSGIPQVSGEMKGYLKTNPLRIIIAKMAGGTIAILGGLSLGREGPSIQLGAMAGKKFAEVRNKGKTKEKTYISCGAGAGLAAAFNAPLAGVMFSLEEIHKNFDSRVIVSVMAAAVTADFLSKAVFGYETVFHYATKTIPLSAFWLILLIGIIVGVCGSIYNWAMIKGQKLYGKLTMIKQEYRIIIPFMFAGILSLTYPKVLAGGNQMINILLSENYVFHMLVTMLIIKFLFSVISFGSGAPGGIFFPLLVLGSFIGAAFGSFFATHFGMDTELINDFIILAMAGFFSATVRAPITGIILIAEMTGSLEHLIAITLVCIISYVVAYLCKSEPIYESLLDGILEKNEIKVAKPEGETMLITYNVAMGSPVDNKRINQIEWPQNCLIVAIERGDNEYIPRAYNKIKAGDFVTVLINEDEHHYLNEMLTEIFCDTKRDEDGWWIKHDLMEIKNK